jgi:hypothetical protein
MIIDVLLAIVLGLVTQSVWVFSLIVLVGAIFSRPDRPFASGVLKFALIALGISWLMSLGGDDCDCDV